MSIKLDCRLCEAQESADDEKFCDECINILFHFENVKKWELRTPEKILNMAIYHYGGSYQMAIVRGYYNS